MSILQKITTLSESCVSSIQCSRSSNVDKISRWTVVDYRQMGVTRWESWLSFLWHSNLRTETVLATVVWNQYDHHTEVANLIFRSVSSIGSYWPVRFGLVVLASLCFNSQFGCWAFWECLTLIWLSLLIVRSLCVVSNMKISIVY